MRRYRPSLINKTSGSHTRSSRHDSRSLNLHQAKIWIVLATFSLPDLRAAGPQPDPSAAEQAQNRGTAINSTRAFHLLECFQTNSWRPERTHLGPGGEGLRQPRLVPLHGARSLREKPAQPGAQGARAPRGAPKDPQDAGAQHEAARPLGTVAHPTYTHGECTCAPTPSPAEVQLL
ncbi:unnamed protein product [Coccothraustes coccothraustes]